MTDPLSAARAIPKQIAAHHALSVAANGIRYSGRSMSPGSSREKVSSAGTKMSSTTISWLPVPRSPPECHVSNILYDPFGTYAILISGTPTARIICPPSSGVMTYINRIQSASSQPDTSDHLPDTRKPPG